MATKLEELRAKYPDYSDMTDEDFARAFHKKFYSDIDFEDFAGRIGFQSTTIEEPKLAPEGYEIVETYGDGGRIVKNVETGQESYMSDAYTTSDPARVAEIRAAQGAAGDIYRGELAQEIAGEIPTRAASMAKGIPFVRGYVEPVFGAARSIGQGVSPSTATDTIREAIARREQEAPMTVGASRLATGIGTVAATAPQMTAKTLIGRTAQAAGYGGALGAAEGFVGGFGEGLFTRDGDFDTAMETAKRQAGIGGLAGTVFGAAGEPIAAGAGAVYGSYLREPVREIVENIGFKKDAANVVEEFLAMDAAQAVESAEQVGPYGSISTLGPNTEALLDAVANTPSEGARIARQNLDETALAAANDLTTRLDDVLGEPTPVGEGILAQKSNIMISTAAERREAYDAAYDFQIDADTEGGAAVLELFGRVDPSDLAGAKTLLRQAGENPDLLGGRRISAEEITEALADAPEGSVIVSNADGSYTVQAKPTVATIDYVTQQLYDAGQALKQQGQARAAQSKMDLARQIRGALDEINPDYAKARAAGKDAIDQKLAADLGNDILSPRVTREDVSLAMKNVDEIGLEQLKTALRNRVDELMANAKVNPRARTDAEVVEALAALKAMNNRAVAQKLELALGKEAADKIGEQIAQTSGALLQQAQVAAGSRTNIRRLVDERLKEVVGEPLGATVGRQGILPTIAGAAADSVLGGPSQRERIASLAGEIAPVLTQRMTPTDLRRQAELMQQMTGYIDRASRGARGARELTAGTAQGIGLQQARREEQDPATVRLMRELGLDQFVNRMR
jgi:hypothetical protein